MKKYFPFILFFALLFTGCGAGGNYTPTVITSSRLDISSAPERTIENSVEEISDAVLSVESEISSVAAPSSASSKKSSSASSMSTSSKASSAVSSAVSTTSSTTTSSQQSPVISSASSTAPAPANGQDIEVVSLTSPIIHGQEASITIKGMPGVEYTIKVIYKSGPSEASGLSPKAAGSDGTVTWTWKVSSRTTAGNWNIEISGGGATITVPFIVTE